VSFVGLLLSWNVGRVLLLLISHLFSPSQDYIRTFSRSYLAMEATKDTTTDVAMEQQAAEQLQGEIIPGTEVMKDFGNSHLAKAGGNGSV
jgi:hypothetical protein